MVVRHRSLLFMIVRLSQGKRLFMIELSAESFRYPVCVVNFSASVGNLTKRPAMAACAGPACRRIRPALSRDPPGMAVCLLPVLGRAGRAVLPPGKGRIGEGQTDTETLYLPRKRNLS
jgi:hypothetical protein